MNKTPEEKANKLIEKFEDLTLPNMCDGYKDVAKQCAAICVQEIIKEHTWKFPMMWNIKREAYWQSVLAAINK
jgi:hypothetical protein